MHGKGASFFGGIPAASTAQVPAGSNSFLFFASNPPLTLFFHTVLVNSHAILHPPDLPRGEGFGMLGICGGFRFGLVRSIESASFVQTVLLRL